MIDAVPSSDSSSHSRMTEHIRLGICCVALFSASIMTSSLQLREADCWVCCHSSHARADSLTVDTASVPSLHRAECQPSIFSQWGRCCFAPFITCSICRTLWHTIRGPCDHKMLRERFCNAVWPYSKQTHRKDSPRCISAISQSSWQPCLHWPLQRQRREHRPMAW